jgi:ABC-type sugar transport system substrate-binding protein
MAMKTFTTAALLALGAAALLPSAAAAQAPIYQWCVQPSGPRGPDCYYATLEQCRASASAVGFCYQNPAYTVATQGKPQRR